MLAKAFTRRSSFSLTVIMTKVSPIVTPSISSSLSLESPTNHRRVSTSSVQSLASVIASAASSVSSIPFSGEPEVVKAEGLRHASIFLDARQYKKPSFLLQLLECIRALKVPSWHSPSITPEQLKIHKVSGSLTNAVFFVSCPSVNEALTILLRIYGPSSGSLISRPRELHTLHILSSRYNLGPKVYGTFENGRMEEYFPSKTLTAQDMRDPQISRWIGARMAELHSVPIDVIEETSPGSGGEGTGWQLGAKKNVWSWLASAKDVLMHPNIPQFVREEFDLDRFQHQWESYIQWLSGVDDVHNGSRRVFAHNDTQYGNLLRLEGVEVRAPHRQLIVVDFEYASPNPASFDIANHFLEWTYNYHTSTPHLPDENRYPTPQERENFYLSYLEHTGTSSADRLAQQAKGLEKQVRYWTPACHAMWCMWGIVQATDDVINNVTEPEFDYIGYSRFRMLAFRRSVATLGII
ncbi:choline kinase, cytoplasm [Lentinula raphanica]|uniref:Choline kinase, cytoplasm n=1 Tax=Lentinula raphanica TaxID=153919 RepID=A0AA38PHT2_9AGAR|nr:choline kinase, cytoplasm [Lentinula raphanica]